MIKIKEFNPVRNGHQFDYLLEDGTLLHEKEWNGETHTVKNGKDEVGYRPVYKEEDKNYTVLGFTN